MTRDQFRPPDHDTEHFLPTTIVGSFPQPDWLDRVRAVADEDEEFSAEGAHDDACRLTIFEFERMGLDVVTDGEMRRGDMVEYFTNFVDGYEPSDGSDSGWNAQMPSVVDQVTTAEPWLVDDFEFAASVAERPVKTTVTGPFTLASFASPGPYDSVPSLATDFAELVAAEAERLADAGARYIQIDEPGLGMTPHGDLAVECLSEIDARVPSDVRLSVHVCSGNYTNLVPDLFEFPVDEIDLEFASDDADDPAEIFDGVDLDVDVAFGVVDSSSKTVESVPEIRENIEYALSIIPPERLTVTTDCGTRPLTRDAATGKVTNMVSAAREVESQLDDGTLVPDDLDPAEF